MGVAVAHFEKHSCRAECLWVFEENQRARRFYERHGW